METLTSLMRSKLTVVWAVLVGATLISFWMGGSHGLPSTYASIISTLQARDYVRLDGKAFTPTDVGMIVNKFLTDHFTRYVDYQFTANLEDDLDAVSRGEERYQ